MSDLAKSLLSQYYGLNSESTNRTFVSIHKSIENAKTEEEKQFTEQTSVTTNEENIVSEDEYQVLRIYYNKHYILFQFGYKTW